MTTKRVDFFEAARAELIEAMSWYAERDRAVARRFIIEVRRVTRLIESHSGIGAPWDDARLAKPVRRIPLTKFPYLIVYIDAQTIQIVAVAHSKRRPGYWKTRITQ